MRIGNSFSDTLEGDRLLTIENSDNTSGDGEVEAVSADITRARHDKYQASPTTYRNYCLLLLLMAVVLINIVFWTPLKVIELPTQPTITQEQDRYGLNLSDSDQTRPQEAVFLDGVGLSQQRVRNNGTVSRSYEEYEFAHQHSHLADWQTAELPTFLLSVHGCKQPPQWNSADIIPTDNEPSTAVSYLRVFLPIRSPSQHMHNAWSKSVSASWYDQRSLFSAGTAPLSYESQQYSSNGSNWITLEQVGGDTQPVVESDTIAPNNTRVTGQGTATMHWNQYQPMLIYMTESLAGTEVPRPPKCRGASSFEYSFVCRPNANAPENYRSRPSVFDHGNGIQTLRLLFESPGICTLRIYPHTITDVAGFAHLVMPTAPTNLTLDAFSIDLTIFVEPFNEMQLLDREPILRGPTLTAKLAHELLWSRHHPSADLARTLGVSTRDAVNSYLLQLASSSATSYSVQTLLALRIRRRGECTLADYTSMSTWTGAWYQFPREISPCIRRPHYQTDVEGRPPTLDQLNAQSVEESFVNSTDPYLGPMCSFDRDDSWQWPGSRGPNVHPNWVFVREECYLHKYSASTLWSHWHDERILLAMDSNGQDMLRTIALEFLHLQRDLRDVARTFNDDHIDIRTTHNIPPNEVSRIVTDVCTRPVEIDQPADSCTISLGMRFPQVEPATDHLGLAFFELVTPLASLTAAIDGHPSGGAVTFNMGLHDRDLIDRGRLDPWRVGLKRRASWCLVKDENGIDRNYSFVNPKIRHEDLNAALSNSVPLGEVEVVDHIVAHNNVPVALPYRKVNHRAMICDDLPMTCRDTGSCGPPETHAAWRMVNAADAIQDNLDLVIRSNWKQQLMRARKSVRAALIQQIARNSTYLAPIGSIAREEQIRMSTHQTHTNITADPVGAHFRALLPLYPQLVFRCPVCPAGRARAEQVNPTTAFILCTEARNMMELRNQKTRNQWIEFAHGAPDHQHVRQARSVPQSHPVAAHRNLHSDVDLPSCRALSRTSMQWLNIDAYTMTDPWHFTHSHSDGGHYGRTPCSNPEHSGPCAEDNFVDGWAVLANLHAITLAKEAHIRHAFQPASLFNTNQCHEE